MFVVLLSPQRRSLYISNIWIPISALERSCFGSLCFDLKLGLDVETENLWRLVIVFCRVRTEVVLGGIMEGCRLFCMAWVTKSDNDRRVSADKLQFTTDLKAFMKQ